MTKSLLVHFNIVNIPLYIISHKWPFICGEFGMPPLQPLVLIVGSRPRVPWPSSSRVAVWSCSWLGPHYKPLCDQRPLKIFDTAHQRVVGRPFRYRACDAVDDRLGWLRVSWVGLGSYFKYSRISAVLDFTHIIQVQSLDEEDITYLATGEKPVFKYIIFRSSVSFIVNMISSDAHPCMWFTFTKQG